MLVFHHNDALLVIVALILHGHLHLHTRLISIYLRRCDEDTILGNVQRRHSLQPHVAVDA